MYEAYDHDPDYCCCTDGWSRKINRIIEKEIIRRLTDRQRQIESDNEYYKTEMFRAKNKLRDMEYQLESTQKEAEKIAREAVRIAQREYWFDCAIGDTVYLIKHDYVPYKCEKCGNTQKVPVMIDGIEVKAECPICGTYSKREKLRRCVPKIVKGRIERLQIELANNHKWINIWLYNSEKEYKFDVEVYKVFLTMEEAELALEQEKAKEAAYEDK